jgi:AcrR family transcriptional regulator
MKRLLHSVIMTSRKAALTQKVAAHLLSHGISDSGIRALAKAAGTSDRMLVYYFGSKEVLLREATSLIVSGLSGQLDELLGSARRSRSRLLAALTETCRDPAFLPMIRLWFEVVGLAARGARPYHALSHDIAGVFIDWIENHLASRQRGEARELFAHLEGRMLLHVIGLDDGR